jgi:hypothetical protein
MKGGFEVGRTKTTRSLSRAVFSSPLLVAVGAAASVVFVLSFAGYVRRGGFWSSEVEARVLTRGKVLDSSSQSLNGQRVFAFQGEVFSDAERLREAAALGLGSMLFATQRNLDHAPISSVEALLRAMASDGLLPPDMVLDQSGPSVTSKYAVYYVRYRLDPLGVEIVSIGKGSLSGPALLVRLPDDEFSQNALTYYVAPRTGGGVTVPVAFAAPAQIIATGWQPVTFKSSSVSSDEAEKGRQWLAGGKSQSSSSR